MNYRLYHATDKRDGRPMLWLHCTRTAKVAQFHPKTAVSRIKRLTAVAPGGSPGRQRATWRNMRLPLN